MTKKTAAEILHKFNLWRYGHKLEQQSPQQVTIAIDTAIKHLRDSIKAGQVAKKRAMRGKSKKP